MAVKQPRAAARRWSWQKFNRLLGDRPLWDFSAAIREKTGKTIGPTTLFSYRKGKSVPSFDKACAIAATLGVSLMDDLSE